MSQTMHILVFCQVLHRRLVSLPRLQKNIIAFLLRLFITYHLAIIIVVIVDYRRFRQPLPLVARRSFSSLVARCSSFAISNPRYVYLTCFT